jgi:MATE family multidrug resistance protein
MWLFLKQAIPNTFATCIEWWAQEFIALLAGLLPHASLTVASNGVLFNCAVVFYMTWVGSKNAMATRVGNLIGSGRCHEVPRAAAVGLGLCAAEIVLAILLGWHYRLDIVSMFTANPELQSMVLQTWSTMLLVLVPYSFTFMLFGILSGAGQQDTVAYVFLASLVLGMPYGVYLTFVLNYALDGLWIGNGLFFGIAGFVLLIKVLQIDWSSKQMLEHEQHYIMIDEDPSAGA